MRTLGRRVLGEVPSCDWSSTSSSGRRRTGALRPARGGRPHGQRALIVPLVREALARERATAESTLYRLVRIGADVGGDRVIALLKLYGEHPFHVVQREVLHAL